MKFNAKKILAIMMALLVACSMSFAKKIDADTKIVNSDWKDKALGEQENPAWVYQLIHGNDSVFRREFGIRSDRVIRTGRGAGYTQNSAKTKSQLNVAAGIANELKMNIITNLASANNVTQEQIETVDRIASATTVQISSLREENDFWWKTLERDPVTKKVITKYAYVTVYSMPKDVWDKTVETYLLSIMRNVEVDVQRALGAQASTLKGLSSSDGSNQAAMKNQYAEVTKNSGATISDEQKDLDEADALLMSMFQ